MAQTQFQQVTPKWVLALLGAGFLAVLITLLWMGCYAQPAKDDYLSAVMFRDKTFWEGLVLQYKEHNGRLASAAIMWFSPLRWHSFLGYKIACLAFICIFAASVFSVVVRALRAQWHPADRMAVFFAVYLCIHGAIGNCSEFYYWLPAISCYGLPFIGLVALAAVLPKPGHAYSTGRLFLAAILCCTLPLFSEVGSLMAGTALAFFWIRQRGTLPKLPFMFLLALVLAATLLSAFSPGNTARMAATPYNRTALSVAGSGLYSFLGIAWAGLYFLLPAALFIGAVMCSEQQPRQILDTKKLLKSISVVTLLSFLAALFSAYALGGLPPLRLQNGILLFLAFFLPCCFSLAAAPPTTALSRRSPQWASLLAVWICCSIFTPGHQVRNAAEELIAGIPQQYDADMKTVYRTAGMHEHGRDCKVPRVREIPSTLFIEQPLLLKPGGWPYFQVKMANYFGCNYLYADSLAKIPDPDEAFQNYLKRVRRKK